MDNWNWIEVVWTLIAATGAYFSSRNIRDGLADLKVLRSRAGNGLEKQILHIAAYGSTRRDSMRFCIQVAFGMIGVLAGFAPNNPNPTLLGLLASFVFLLSSTALTASAYFDYHDRIRLRDLGVILASSGSEDGTNRK